MYFALFTFHEFMLNLCLEDDDKCNERIEIRPRRHINKYKVKQT